MKGEWVDKNRALSDPLMRPTTGPGGLLRSVLAPHCADQTKLAAAANVVGKYARISHSRAAGGILTYAFTVAMRRRFACEYDPRVVMRYVREALSRREWGSVDDDRLRRAELVARSALGEPWLREDLERIEVGYIALLLLIDLIRAEGMTKRQLDELLFAGELHDRLFGEQGGRRHRRRILRFRGGDEADVVRYLTRPPDPSRGPHSLVGQWLRSATIAGGKTPARRPSANPDDVAVFDAAFEIAVSRRFVEGYGPHDVAKCATSVTTWFHRDGLTAEAIQAEMTQQLEQPEASVAGINHDRRLARLAATVGMLNDLGLLHSELDEVISQAEQLAAERGFTPQPAD